ncbi:sigma-70 family RNA polymerase sigma factor [Weissella hellenica]|nr:sigma-70 family RNA polymerase sigma factor [Weissella hellenica]
MNVDEIIQYMDDNIRWGSKISRSELNELIRQGGCTIDASYQIYKEVSELNLSVFTDASSLLKDVIHISMASWQDDIKTLIQGLPEQFSLSDIYLFEFDLGSIHIENQNIRAKIRQILQQLRDKGDILFVSDGVYHKVKQQSNIASTTEGGKLNISDDFDDFEDLDDVLKSDKFNNQYNNILDIPDFSNNSHYIIEYQKSDSTTALDTLMRANEKLVSSIAKKYVGQTTVGYDFDDMVVEGMLGLKKAAEKFDLSLGYEFSTYATWWIRQAISRGISDQSTTIRLPVHLREKLNKERTAENKLFLDLSRSATNDEIAAYLDITVDKIIEYRSFQYRFENNLVSLSLPVGSTESDTTLSEMIPEYDVKSEFDIVSDNELRKMLMNLLLELKDREREVLILRFGLEDSSIHTLAEIGEKMGVTRERIRQIESRALRKLKSKSNAKQIKEFLS